ncbi:creatininase family protein [bacterium]|nr:creatininase family protein [bacterium]
MIRKINELNLNEIRDYLSKNSRIFIPFGTLEAHGHHLPSGTDNICAESLSNSCAEKLNALIAPTLCYGLTNTLFSYEAGSDFDDELYTKFITQLIENFIHHGFNELILVNGHGGNVKPLNKVANDLSQKHKVSIITVHWWIAYSGIAEKYFNSDQMGHAAQEETAFILAFKESLVCKKNFAVYDVMIAKKGFGCYPCSGPVITNGEPGIMEGLFDRDRAVSYTEEVISQMILDIENAFKGLRREFPKK